MKKLICLALALMLAFGMTAYVFAEDADPVIEFKDLLFEDVVRRNLHKPTGNIHLSDVQMITALDLGNRNNMVALLTDVSELVYFSSLEELRAGDRSQTYIKEINLSHCPNLRYLDLYGNDLNTIDVSHNTNLEYLNLRSNHIRSVDLSNNPKLEFLDLSLENIILPRTNPFSVGEEVFVLESVDVTHNPELKELHIWSGTFSTLDLTKNTKLEKVIIYSVPIDKIDVTHCPDLKVLHITGNLSELDLSHNTKLNELVCTGNKIEKLDLSNNTQLNGELFCEYNPLTELKIGGTRRVTDFHCQGTKLKSIDPSLFPNLKTLYCGYCGLDFLDVSHNPELTELSCDGNNLTSLDLTHNPELADLWASENKFSTIDLSENKKIDILRLSDNKLTSLDLTNNTEISSLYLNNNKLSSLDLSANKKLRFAEVKNNKLTSLDLTGNPKIGGVYISFNYLTSEDDVIGWSNWDFLRENFPKDKGDPFWPQRSQDGFEDVDPDDWYYNIINEARERELVAGFDDNTFSPGTSITRAQFAVILANYEGVPTSGSEVRFDDVNTGTWYTGAVDWADKNGIMIGVTENWFAPHRPITREQLMTALYRYAEYKGYTFEKVYTDIFEDDTEISKWARECVMAMKANGIVVGKGGNCFAPKDETTRAEATQIMLNFVKMIES